MNQHEYYDTSDRSYATLDNTSKSFPDLDYFTGLNCVRDQGTSGNLIGTIPTYIPQCASASGGGQGPSLNAKPPSGPDVSDQVSHEVEAAYREVRNMVYRLRICDYFISEYAWNTRGRGVDSAFTYSWRTGCNSFANENSGQLGLDLANAAGGLEQKAAKLDAATAGQPHARTKGGKQPATSPAVDAATSDFDQAFSDFNFKQYDLYDDLNQRLQSCASVNLNYPTNTRRFFCSYGGFIGALLAASATAFGKHWGGATSSTQSQVQGLGTVMIALPALCLNGGSSAKGGKGG